MRKIFLFMNVSLDGYFEGPGHDISGFTGDFAAFSQEGSDAVDTLLFGHNTYDMFKGFWTTPQAEKLAPQVAAFINGTRKVVVSHAAFEPGWQNATVISGDVATGLRALKDGPGKTIGVFGSNTLCVSLLEYGMLDELQIIVNPVVFGDGTTLFKGLSKRIKLELKDIHKFDSGTMLLRYEIGLTDKKGS